MKPLTPDRLAIHTVTTRPWSLAQACEAYAAAGVAGICPWVEHVEPVGVHEAARAIEGCGLRVPAYVRGGFFAGRSRGERAEAVDRNRALVDDAAVLSADVLVVVPGACPGVALSDARGMVADGLAAVAEHAESVGVKLAVEPLHPMYAADRSCVNTIASARAICDWVDHPALGVAVDVYHVWWDPGLPEQIIALGEENRLTAFHICDFKADTRDLLLDRGLMGEGVIPLAPIREAVEAVGFCGLVEIEILSTHYWKADQSEYLAQLIAAASAKA